MSVHYFRLGDRLSYFLEWERRGPNPSDWPMMVFGLASFGGSSPGARIEFNDAYVGTTPCRIRVPGGIGRKFSSGKILGHDFKALPLPSGGSTQIKRFDAGSDIPEHLFFDMRLSYR